jgi:hypothetical protein
MCAFDGNIYRFVATPTGAQDGNTPDKIQLNQNYPNPFNPKTMLSFLLPEERRVGLHVYDGRGRLVVTLVDGVKQAGLHEVPWNATDALGRSVGSGVYFYRLDIDTGGESVTRKMVLLK